MTDTAFITDMDIEKALDYLRDEANAAAQARADRVYVQEYLKTVKSLIMKEHSDESGIAQEREAYADPRYVAHLRAIQEAVERDEKHRFLREAASARIDAWRTASSNYRAMKI